MIGLAGYVTVSPNAETREGVGWLAVVAKLTANLASTGAGIYMAKKEMKFQKKLMLKQQAFEAEQAEKEQQAVLKQQQMALEQAKALRAARPNRRPLQSATVFCPPPGFPGLGQAIPAGAPT